MLTDEVMFKVLTVTLIKELERQAKGEPNRSDERKMESL